jgi:hypothetical protein
MCFSFNNATCVLEAIFGGGSGTFSSSVSEDDVEEDENAFVGEYSGDDRLLELELGGDGGLLGGS